MNILLIGSGGREHALAWRLSAGRLCDTLFIMPGNPGTARCGVNIPGNPLDAGEVLRAAREHTVELVVFGPEAPLTAGVSDVLEQNGIRVFGPSRAAAALEGSKSFTKDLCREFGIPTAGYRVFQADEEEDALAYVRGMGAPIVIKADGLAAGKGVVVAATVAEAEGAVKSMLGGAFGNAGATVVIEECLIGEEVSFFVLSDGETALPFGSAQDHKRAFDNDEGPNTGGMGAYSPVSVVDADMERRILDDIIRPTLAGMRARGTPFKGALFAGLMLTADGPKLIEYNVRFGDPECQVLMRRLTSDLSELLWAAACGTLAAAEVELSQQTALVVVLASKGYPGAYAKGSVIAGLDEAEAVDDVVVFHSGTALDANGALTAAGGRVLSVTGLGSDIREARARAYEAVANIRWPEGFCRSDIGRRELERPRGKAGSR
ncbi:MAG: phosphoribosylamine--glycine ligase [Methylobacteriaceae bacterium]|nr:phosphoribosylamine--glycine ligase [Methylobacteriaceae bacterium]